MQFCSALWPNYTDTLFGLPIIYPSLALRIRQFMSDSRGLDALCFFTCAMSIFENSWSIGELKGSERDIIEQCLVWVCFSDQPHGSAGIVTPCTSFIVGSVACYFPAHTERRALCNKTLVFGYFQEHCAQCRKLMICHCGGVLLQPCYLGQGHV
jgi:hypothetical protein